MTKPRIGLALSGGGFRATFYHLGVVRLLRDYNLLSAVQVISSVSGGSLLAPLLALNWAQLLDGVQDFDAAFAPLKRLARIDVRNKQTRLLPWQIGLPFAFSTSTQNAAAAYDSYLLGNQHVSIATLAQSTGAPKFFIMASDLNNPECLFSFSDDGVRSHHENGEIRLVNTTAPLLSVAIAASSAFPPFFLPLEVTKDLLGCRQEQLPHYPISLTDGGVYDNSGVVALRHLPKAAPAIDTIIVSDASRSLDFDHESRYPASRRKTLLRVLDTLQTRLASEIEATSGSNEHWVRLNGEIDKGVNCSPELRNDIALIRTDLDVFSDAEISALMHLGYAQAEHQLRNLIGSEARADKFRPFSPEASNLLPQRLSSSARLRVKWLGRDLATLLNSLLVLAVVAAILTLTKALFFPGSNVPGLVQFYPESRELLPDVAASIEASQAEIVMVGTHFSITLDQRSETLLRALERGVNVTIVVLDPASEYFEAAAANVGNSVSELRKECEISLEKFNSLKVLSEHKSAAGDPGSVGKLSIKFANVPFAFRAYAVDWSGPHGAIFINPYLDRLRSIASPGYQLDPTSELGRKYIQSIRATLDAAE